MHYLLRVSYMKGNIFNSPSLIPLVSLVFLLDLKKIAKCSNQCVRQVATAKLPNPRD